MQNMLSEKQKSGTWWQVLEFYDGPLSWGPVDDFNAGHKLCSVGSAVGSTPEGPRSNPKHWKEFLTVYDVTVATPVPCLLMPNCSPSSWLYDYTTLYTTLKSCCIYLEVRLYNDLLMTFLAWKVLCLHAYAVHMGEGFLSGLLITKFKMANGTKDKDKRKAVHMTWELCCAYVLHTVFILSLLLVPSGCSQAISPCTRTHLVCSRTTRHWLCVSLGKVSFW